MYPEVVQLNPRSSSSQREKERERETANTLIGRRLNFHDGHPRYFARGFVFLPLRTRNLARILGTWHAFNIMGKRVLRGISLEAGSETVKRVDLQVLTFLAAIPIAPPQNDRHFFLRRSLPLVEEKRFPSITVIIVINVEYETSFRKWFEFLLWKLFRFFSFWLLPFVSAAKYMVKVFQTVVFILTKEIVIYLFIYFWSS